MRSLGIDIGSRTIKLVLMEDGVVVHSNVMKNTYNHEQVLPELIAEIDYDIMIATGYGRHFFAETDAHRIITEIKAFAIGMRHLFPQVDTILDIGGQDTKVISLDPNGGIRKFFMNDKCAAGTGRFLEIMASALNMDLSEFGNAALKTKKSEKINNMCAVFAESEVISSLSKGARREEVARGIHESVVKRSLVLLQKTGIGKSVSFGGGVAKNPCIRELLESNLKTKVMVPDNPQLTGAMGCAVYGMKIKND